MRNKQRSGGALNFGHSYRPVTFKYVSIGNVNFRDESPGLKGGLNSDLNPALVHATCHIGLEPIRRLPRGRRPVCPPATIVITVARSYSPRETYIRLFTFPHRAKG